MKEESRPIKFNEGAKQLGISYSTLYRISRNPNSAFLECIYWMNGAYFVDCQRFLKIAQEQAKLRSKE